MTRIRLIQTCALGATVLLATTSFAQQQPMQPMPPPAPPGAPPIVPEQPPPPPPYSAPMSPIAATAPLAADDMTGSIGFGIGLSASTQIIGTSFATSPTTSPTLVALRYWTSDTMVLQPGLAFGLTKTDGVDASWNLNPEMVALFVPVRGASTRLLVGGGLGIGLNKVPMNDTAFMFYLPIQAGVEHFLARWFAVGLAARTNFFQMATGDPYSISMAINTMSLMGSAFIYTD